MLIGDRQVEPAVAVEVPRHERTADIRDRAADSSGRGWKEPSPLPSSTDTSSKDRCRARQVEVRPSPLKSTATRTVYPPPSRRMTGGLERAVAVAQQHRDHGVADIDRD